MEALGEREAEAEELGLVLALGESEADGLRLGLMEEDGEMLGELE